MNRHVFFTSVILCASMLSTSPVPHSPLFFSYDLHALDTLQSH